MKALSSNLLQTESQKTHNNGIVQLDSSQAAYNYMATVDLNGIVQEEPVVQPAFYHMASIDLNGTNLQNLTHQSFSQYPPAMETTMHKMSSFENRALSEVEMQKIQVLCIFFSSISWIEWFWHFGFAHFVQMSVSFLNGFQH